MPRSLHCARTAGESPARTCGLLRDGREKSESRKTHPCAHFKDGKALHGPLSSVTRGAYKGSGAEPGVHCPALPGWLPAARSLGGEPRGAWLCAHKMEILAAWVIASSCWNTGYCNNYARIAGGISNKDVSEPCLL